MPFSWMYWADRSATSGPLYGIFIALTICMMSLYLTAMGWSCLNSSRMVWATFSAALYLGLSVR